MLNADMVIKIKNVSKYFSKVIANKDVSFDIKSGQVLALLGENGAGKSTIMKILYGLYKKDSGEIIINGKPALISTPKDAMQYGIAMIQQHFSLVGAHDVVENIILGNRRGIIDYKSCEKNVKMLANQYGFKLPLRSKVKDLDVGTQQKIEILKALYCNARVLIMDEPTAVLTPQESEKLMAFVRTFVEQGRTVVFITHKLREVMTVADRIVVMRNGHVCGDFKKSELDEAGLSRIMIGREIVQPSKKSVSIKENSVKLKVDNICLKRNNEPDILKNISFEVKSGEVFAIAGVSGNGQEALCEVLSGIQRETSGSIYLNQQDITKLSIKQRIKHGVGYVPVDRYRDGMIMNMALYENMFLKLSFDKIWRRGIFIDFKKIKDHTRQAILQYQVKTTGEDDIAGNLSGGNQQKVVFARELNIASELLILNQPTRGLDLGAINYIHSTILTQREQGKAVVLISTEFSEIFALADRIGMMYKGELLGVYQPVELTAQKIGLLLAGYKEGEAQ